MSAKFQTGRLLTTRGVFNLMTENDAFSEFMEASLKRFIEADWGDIMHEYGTANDEALELGDLSLMGYYEHSEHEDWHIWIITEADRSATTILFHHEY